MQARLCGHGPGLPRGFGTLLTEAVFGGIWSRPGLIRAAFHSRRGPDRPVVNAL
jgi:hypothetical protein